VRFWRAVRERPSELAPAVAATPYSRCEWAGCRHPGAGENDIEAARRLLMDIDQSFGRARCGWSPPSIAMDRRGRWQPGVWENLPPKLLAAAELLRGVALEQADAIELIPRWDQPHTLIHVDPPYTGPLRLAPDKRYRVDDDGALWDRLVDVLAEIRRAAVIGSARPGQRRRTTLTVDAAGLIYRNLSPTAAEPRGTAG
jgi:DNA adenine methylase